MFHHARVLALLILQTLALMIVCFKINRARRKEVVSAVLALLDGIERGLETVKIVFHCPPHFHQCLIHGLEQFVAEILVDCDFPSHARKLVHDRILDDGQPLEARVDVLAV
ncbi:MAG: hypothetical protein P4M08_00345 [Oligoflexia bacterium]|nr:hypothetical protein [Oligoflexia bacterium]